MLVLLQQIQHYQGCGRQETCISMVKVLFMLAVAGYSNGSCVLGYLLQQISLN